MSRRAAIWAAFIVVHVGVAWLGFVLPNQPMGDVYLVYEPWSTRALTGAAVMGVTEPWVYPPLALVPMNLAHMFAPLLGYVVGWAVLVSLVDAVAFALLLGTGRARSRVIAAWFWLAFIALLGPVGLYRLDGLTVPLVIIGCLWLSARPWVAGAILAVATWIKVWPAAVLAAAVIALRRRAAIIGGATAVSVLTLGSVLLAGAGSVALSFIGEQTTRGLQVEAPVAGPYLWGALLGIPGYQVYYSYDLLTFQVTGTDIDFAIAVMTPLLIVVMLGVAALGAIQLARGVRPLVLLAPLALALVLGFIVCNKVGSPQYLSWLVPPVILGIVLQRRRWRAPAALALAAAGLTQLVYPVLYHGILYPEPLAVTVLTVRNIAVVALFAWMLVRLWRLPVALPLRQDAAGAPVASA